MLHSVDAFKSYRCGYSRLPKIRPLTAKNQCYRFLKISKDNIENHLFGLMVLKYQMQI